MAAPVARVTGAAAACLMLTSCYTLQAIPGGAAPTLGMSIAMDLNDAGRAALGGSMGPEILQVEGRLTRNDDDAYQVAVASIRLLRGGEQTWAGEKVSIRKEYVARLYEKHLSKGRTAAAAAVGVGVVAYFATKAIIGAGLGTDPEGKPPIDTAGHSLRRPVRP
ncbi:MAG: hypothetical protein IT356_05250 [Gemmatimonadaceae bacterium]|nr:hypothetical protein [Gemmatimonadaceae bacterium]